MKSVSDIFGGENINPATPAPEIRAFDAASDDFDDADGLEDTPLEVVSPHGDGGGDRDPEPDPVACAAVALTIHAPHEPVAVTHGYTVYAVTLGRGEDGEDDVLAGQTLSRRFGHPEPARQLADFHATDPTHVEIDATHVFVNDHVGRTVYRRALARAA